MSKFKVDFAVQKGKPFPPKVEVEALDFNTAAATAEAQNPGFETHMVQELNEGGTPIGARFSGGRCQICGLSVFMNDLDVLSYRLGVVIHSACYESKHEQEVQSRSNPT